MADDIRWGDESPDNRNQNDQRTGDEILGDTDAPDIVGRTGEEMPEVAHDDRDGKTADTQEDTRTMEQRSADAADEAGSTFLPYDKVFAADEGLRRPAPKDAASDATPDPATDKHTEATMPPGEGQNSKRNTM